MINSERDNIDNLVHAFFAIFDNRSNKTPNFTKLERMFTSGAMIVKKDGEQIQTMTLNEFISPRRTLLTDGRLVEFNEWETNGQTHISGHIATRISQYAKSGLLRGEQYTGKGVKHIQLILTQDGWKIASVAWEDFT